MNRVASALRRSLLLTLPAIVSPLFAQEATTTESLDERLKVLERKLEIADEAAATAARSAVNVTANDQGFRIRTADQRFDLRIRGTFQADYRSFLDDDDVQPNFNDTFILRRVRPTFEGQLGKAVSFRLTPEFAGNNATVVDLYLDLKVKPWLTLRAGKQKGPVGLERLQSASANVFIERAFPTELVPNRDIGITAQGSFLAEKVTYQLGVYNGTADGRDTQTTDVDDHKDLAARLFFEPFRENPGVLQGLGFGVAGSHGRNYGNTVGTGGVLPQLRSYGQNTFFQYLAAVNAAGKHDRWTAQGYYYRYGLGVQAEYVESTQELVAGAVRRDLTNTAWQVTASYVLTGEDNSYRGVARPNKAFGEGGPGAWEIALRASSLDVDSAAFPLFASPTASARRGTQWAAAINWYVNANGKISLNYSTTDYAGGAAAGRDRESEKALFGRFQVAF